MNATAILNQAKTDFGTSKLIMVDQVIRKFLGRVANDPMLYRVLVDCNRGFDYEGEKKKATVHDRFGVRFVLPRNRHTVVALVTGLLYEFDKKEGGSVVNFVLKHFNSDATHLSYQRFLEEVIYPYLAAFADLTAPVVPEEDPPETAPTTVPEAVREEAENWVKRLLDLVIGDNDTYESERKEMILMLNGLTYVLGEQNALLIPIVWTGLKNTFGDYPRGERELQELERVLFNYGVLGSCS